MKETCDPYIVLILQRLLFGQILVYVFCCNRDIRYEDFCLGLLACHVGLDNINCCSTLSGSVLKDCLCHLAVFDCLESFCCAVDTADHDLAQVAVPGGRSVDTAFFCRIDPGLEFSVVCLDESSGPVFVDRDALGGIGGNSDICGFREIEDCVFADDFALDTSGISIQD